MVRAAMLQSSRIVSRVLAIFLLLLLPQTTSYQVEESTYEATDPARSGHRVVATLYLAKDNSVPAPVVAFAHGFGLGATAYPLARELAARLGMIVLLPHNLGVPSTLGLALDQRFLLAHAVEESSNPASLFYKRVANLTVLAGHSLGGGSTLLAADSSLASAYPPPTAIVTVSLGTYTIPNALLSAPRISSQIPALLMTASEDCVDPPQKNSLRVFNQMKSRCAFVVSVVGGSHCQYAARSLGCSLTEKLCGARPNISREAQTDAALNVIIPFLHAALKYGSNGTWANFDASLAHSVVKGNVSLLAQRSESCEIEDVIEQTPAELQDALDSGFAESCQRRVANISKTSSTKLSVEAINVTFAKFLTTKPSLHADPARTYFNVTVLSHYEAAPPFSHGVAIKMKSAQAISPTIHESVTCSDLNAFSLATALSSMRSDERNKYCKTTKCLRFAGDVLWHTGLWVPFSKLNITETGDEIIVAAPRFYASTDVPGDWGGVVYCRLLTPSAIRDWIRSQLEERGGSSTLVI